MKRIVALASIVLLVSSCYSYGYHQRQGGPNFQKIAVDSNLPQSKTLWTYAWGLAGEPIVAPLDCASTSTASEGGEPKCTQEVPVCGGTPPGKVEVGLLWYSALLMIFTLGIVFPAEVTWYCSTEGGGPS